MNKLVAGLPDVEVPKVVADDHDDIVKISDAQPFRALASRSLGLDAEHRRRARKTVLKCAYALLKVPGHVHYTQGFNRWYGINTLHIDFGVIPYWGDCSSTTTWILREALRSVYRYSDVVNGFQWKAGYTGTQIRHGKRIWLKRNLRIGDLIFYGKPRVKHVAIYIGDGYVFSHGSEGGPYKLHVDYRYDRTQMRRYF